MLAFSAAGPVVKGRLVDSDTRLPILEMGSDNRTESEIKAGIKSNYYSFLE